MEGLYGISNRVFSFYRDRVGIGAIRPESRLHIMTENIGTTQNDSYGIILGNQTLAVAGKQQSSAPIVWQGNGWKTNASAASQDVRFRADVLPVQDTANPTGTWQLAASINGAAYSNVLTVTSGGTVSATVFSSSFATASNRINGSIIVSGLYMTAGNNSIADSSSFPYRATNAGSDIATQYFDVADAVISSGVHRLTSDISAHNDLIFIAGNASNIAIARAIITITNLTNTAGSEAADLIFQTQSAGAAATTKMTIAAAGLVTLAGGLTAGGLITTVAGTTGVSVLNFPSTSVLRTTPSVGDWEFDNKNLYFTPESTAGHGVIPVEQRFRLTANGSTISTIANFFGATSNPTLVSGAEYEIEIECYFTNTTAGTVTWTFTNSAAPTLQNIYCKFSPLAGIVAPAGSAAATYLEGNVQGDTTAAKALTTSGTLTNATTQYAYFKIYLINGTGTSLKIQATKLVGGSITPLAGSWYRVRRIPAANVGTLAA